MKMINDITGLDPNKDHLRLCILRIKKTDYSIVLFQRYKTWYLMAKSSEVNPICLDPDLYHIIKRRYPITEFYSANYPYQQELDYVLRHFKSAKIYLTPNKVKFGPFFLEGKTSNKINKEASKGKNEGKYYDEVRFKILRKVLGRAKMDELIDQASAEMIEECLIDLEAKSLIMKRKVEPYVEMEP